MLNITGYFSVSYSKLKRMQTTWLSCNDVCFLYITTTSTDIEFSRFLKPNKNSPWYYWLHYKKRYVFLVCGSVRIYDQLKMIPSQNIQVLVCLAQSTKSTKRSSLWTHDLNPPSIRENKDLWLKGHHNIDSKNTMFNTFNINRWENIERFNGQHFANTLS